MTNASLSQFKAFVRELTNDLDSPFQLALESATAEVDSFLGFDVQLEYGSEGPPSDIVMACLLLAQVHADAGDPAANEHRRTAAHRLLTPHRENTGFGSAS